MKLEDVEVEAWPAVRRAGGQQCGSARAGVIAIHTPTGISVIVGVDDDRSSQMTNRRRALDRLAILVDTTDVETDAWRAK